MGSRLHNVVIGVALGALAIGCGQKGAQQTARSAAPKTAAPASTTVAANGADADREKRPRFGEAAVYVDGKPVGVLRHAELPASFAGRKIALGDGYETTRYYFADYARALGINPKRVKALHVYGGSRVVVVDQAEFQRIGSRLSFSFVQGDRGKPRLHWPPIKLNVNSTIDMLSNVAFYVEKEPPRLEGGELVMPDGSRVETKVPYAPEEQGNGTRVYVDGALVGTVKRRKLTDDVLANGKGDDVSRFSLVAFAATLHPEAAKAKTVDLLAGDDVVARLAPTTARDVTFRVPARNRGQALVEVPTHDGLRPARISAVQIFVSSTPPARSVVKLDEASDARPGSEHAASGQGDDL